MRIIRIRSEFGDLLLVGVSTYEHLAKGRVGVEEESVLEVERRILPIMHLVKPAPNLSSCVFL